MEWLSNLFKVTQQIGVKEVDQSYKASSSWGRKWEWDGEEH